MTKAEQYCYDQGRGELKSAMNQLKECREELRTALDTANRSSKAVLKWNAKIEQRTKEAILKYVEDNLEAVYPDAATLVSVNLILDTIRSWRVIDSVGKK